MNPRHRYIPAVPMIFLFFLLFSLALSCKAIEVNSNIELINRELNIAADSLIAQITKLNSDTVFVSVKTSEADRYFNSILLNKSSGKGIIFYIADTISSKEPYLDIKLSIETNYQNYEEDRDSLVRTIKIIWLGSLRLKDNKLQALKLKNFKYNDIISREDAENFNTADFEFAKTNIPEPPTSFWKDLIQPITIISAGIITVVLLFTLRSK